MAYSTLKRKKKKRRGGWSNRLPIIGITAVILSLAVVVNVGASSLREKDFEYEMREPELEKEVAEEEARADQLEEYRIYVQTKQYIEKVAKEKLGLVMKDEILFKPEESD